MVEETSPANSSGLEDREAGYPKYDSRDPHDQLGYNLWNRKSPNDPSDSTLGAVFGPRRVKDYIEQIIKPHQERRDGN